MKKDLKIKLNLFYDAVILPLVILPKDLTSYSTDTFLDMHISAFSQQLEEEKSSKVLTQ